MKQTQYEQILGYLRKHRVGTVRDLARFSNYPWKRISEMQANYIWHTPPEKCKFGGCVTNTERITRTWVERNGKKVRLYMLTKA